MTGPTLTLTDEQERELRRYASGEPRKPSQRPNTNLIRRNMLRSARQTHGVGVYQITEFGRAALRARGREGQAMKRFLLFGGDVYYPSGGWNDVVDSFDSAAAAAKFARDENRKRRRDRRPSRFGWWHVVDTEAGTVIDSGMTNE